MDVTKSNGEKVTQALIANVLNTRFEDLDQEVVDNTKRRILDMIGDALGGAKCDGSPEMVEIFANGGGKNAATILGYGTKGPVQDAAFVNNVFGRSFDRGPLTYIIKGDGTSGTIYIDGKPIRRFASHITETTALAALAVGETQGINGKDLITSLVVGDDLAARLHIANDRTPPGQAASPDLPPAAPSRGSSGRLGVVAIAGRMLGFDSARLRNAFGISMVLSGGGGMASLFTRSPAAPAGAAGPAKQTAPGGAQRTSAGNPGWLGVHDPFFIAAMERGGYEETISTKMSNGTEARNGIVDVLLGKAGWPGAKNPFFDESTGYYPALERCNHPERITDGLGKIYHVEQVFKPWPGGRPTNQPTEAALGIVSKHDFNSDDIKEIVLHLSPAAAAVHYSKPYIMGGYPTMSSLWSFRYAVANTLFYKSSKDENYTSEKIRNPKLQELIKKINLADLDKDEGVEVEVKLKDGRTFSEYVGRTLGEPYKPLTRDGLIAKFMEQVEFSKLVREEDARKLIDLLENLEKVDNVKKIIELAVKKK